MDAQVLLKVADLRDVLCVLLDEVERQYGTTVDLDVDYYWSLPARQAYLFDSAGPPEATVGQLTDDLVELRRMLVVGDEPVLWHDLAHVIGILNRIVAMD